MQKMFNAVCSPEKYQSLGKAYAFPDMSNNLCPQCKADYLRKHGFYSRYLIEIGFEGLIIIRRYYCPHCKKTLSLLPSFCHPKRAYSPTIIIRLLMEFYEKGKNACLTVKAFIAETGIAAVTRQLLLHFRRRIEENLNNLVMAVIGIHSLKSPPVTERVKAKEKVRQLLSHILYPQDDSLKIFEQTGRTYLTKP